MFRARVRVSGRDACTSTRRDASHAEAESTHARTSMIAGQGRPSLPHRTTQKPVDLPVVINCFLDRTMRKRRPPPACDHAGACDASLCVRPLGFSVKQAIMPVPVSLPDTRTRARNTLRQSLLSHLLVWILFFLISEEFVNNLIYISLISGIHRNNL